jgi:subtilisin-like proprotein convertase family protein
MVCRDIAVDCGEEIPLAPAPALTGPQSIIYTGLNEPIGEPGAPVPDVHVYEYDFSYLPAGTPVQDVDVRVRLTGHTWLPDLNIEVISPSGTVADVFTLTGCTGQEWPIDVIFDDQGQGGLTQCAELNAGGARIQPILAPGQSGTALFVFNGEDASGIWRIRFTDGVALDDGVIEIAGLILTAEAPGIPVTDNCTPEAAMNTIGPRLNYGEDIQHFTCAQNAEISRRITRVWTARDEWNNSAQCVQRIDIRRPSLTSLVLPANYDDLDAPSLDCRDGYPGPEVTGYPAGGGCGSLQMAYTDKVLQVCQGSYTIIRSWTLHDMCTGGIGKHDQIIKVLDKTPPVLFCPAEHDIKLGKTTKQGKDCTVNVMMPWIQVTDDCSTTNNTTFYVWTTLPDGSIVIVNTMNAQGFFVFDLPVQPAPHQYTFTYTAIDDCGNKAECTVNVPVRDLTPPVVICETFHTVGLTDSITFVNAISFDDGSYDDCSMVTFTARRGTMNAAGAFVQHPCNQPGDFLYGPQVRFYCCDINHPTQVFVDLRVRDAYGNDNFCMVPVTVVDKVRPVIWCPDDITVQCGMPFEPTGIDTFVTCIQPAVTISNAFANVYPLTLDIFGIPADARITDLDLKLNINHELVNQLRITLYSPLGRKAEVLTANGCANQPVQFPSNINVTFNDQAYDINVFNQTGQRQPATFRCTNAQPSIGAYNQGHMKAQGDELKVFNGQPLNSFTNKNLCFTVSAGDITVATNRMSNFQVQNFIQQAGLIAGDRILLEYASFTGQPINALATGQVYLFQVINNNTMEFLAVTGSNLNSVPQGSTHMFCASGTWLLVVEDTAPLAGGMINEVCMRIGYVQPTGLKPHATDNTEECGLNITHQDLGQPDKCADNTFINRRWTVADNFGNNTSCIQRVYFNDDTPLTVQFPCDVTVNCPIDPSNTGEVVHNGDCELVGVEYTDHVLVTTDACYKILRSWVVKDWCTYQPDGNVDYPTTNINEALNQITFTTAINTLFTARKINVGDRFTLRYVTSGTTEIPGLIEGDIYSVVRVSGTTVRFEYNTTKQQTVNITGQGVGPHIFRYANSERGLPVTCDVLLEWYPFVDWYTGCCNPVAERRAWEDDGDGYFRFVQEIKVVDNVAPQWVDCSDKEFCSFEADCEPTFVELICEATDQCTPQEQLSYYWSIDLNNDGTIDLEGVSADASGSYPNGTHRIIFKVTDQCGNWNTCTKLFTIRDCKKPTPICINGLSVELMPSTGFVDVWATSFESGDSYDNCTEYENLIIKVERLSQVSPGQNAPDGDAGDVVTVSCLDMPPNTQAPIVEVVIWVGDEAGNWDYCITTLWVQDWMGPCASTMNTELMAHVVNEEQEGVEQVEVHLTGNQGQWPQQLTGSGGMTSFGQVPVQGQYSVTPHKDINPLNGVSTYDLLLIQKHLLGIQSLQSPYKLIAADVNNSCNISVSDIIELRKMILNPGLTFGNNTSWRFVEGIYAFPNPAKPCGFPELKQYNQLQPGLTSAQFIGVKIGDVSGDAVPNSLLGGEVRNAVGTLTFSIADRMLAAGEEYTVAITAEQFRGIQGYQYTLDFDATALEFVGVQAQWADLSAANFGTARAGEGLLTTSWNGNGGVTLDEGEVLYTVTFRAKAATRLSQALKVNSRLTRAEAYDAGEDLLDVQFRFDGDVLVGGEFELYQNEPNPFRDLTIIGFHLPERTTATLKVYDVTGKVLKVVSGEFARGYNQVNLTRAELQGNGALIYQLDTPTHSATKRMILLD